MILLMNLKPSVYHYQSCACVNDTGSDHSINESKIITKLISLSIIHKIAEDSINESEIITRCISLSFIHTGADDSNNKSEIITRCI